MKTRLNFPIDFPNDHCMSTHMGASYMLDALETHMFREFLLERALFNAYCQSNKLVADLKVMLNNQQGMKIEALGISEKQN